MHGEIDARRLVARWGVAAVWVVGGYYTFADHLPHLLEHGMVGWDAHAYWVTGQTHGNLYTRPAQTEDAFLYSPAFADLVRPLALLPDRAFSAVWSLSELGVVVWLLAPGRLSWTVPLFVVACVPEVVLGNVYAFLALALVLLLSPSRRPGGPAAAAFLLLTKVTPGVAVLWFLLRREWRALGMAAVATVGAVVVSLVLGPGRWLDWFDFLRSGSGPTSWWFPLRAALAGGLVVVGARTRRPALVPVAVLLTLPVIGGTSVLTLLAAVPRLRRSQGEGSLEPEGERGLEVVA